LENEIENVDPKIAKYVEEELIWNNNLNEEEIKYLTLFIQRSKLTIDEIKKYKKNKISPEFFHYSKIEVAEFMIEKMCELKSNGIFPENATLKKYQKAGLDLSEISAHTISAAMRNRVTVKNIKFLEKYKNQNDKESENKFLHKCYLFVSIVGPENFSKLKKFEKIINVSSFRAFSENDVFALKFALDKGPKFFDDWRIFFNGYFKTKYRLTVEQLKIIKNIIKYQGGCSASFQEFAKENLQNDDLTTYLENYSAKLKTENDKAGIKWFDN